MYVYRRVMLSFQKHPPYNCMYTYVRTTTAVRTQLTTRNTWSGLMYQMFVWTSGTSNRSLSGGVLASSTHCSCNSVSVCSLASVVCGMAMNMAQILHIFVIQGPQWPSHRMVSVCHEQGKGSAFKGYSYAPAVCQLWLSRIHAVAGKRLLGPTQLPTLWVPTALFTGGGG